MGEKDPDSAGDCDVIPVLKLQAPPKPKCKRQLSSDSHSQPAADRCDQFAPAVKGAFVNSRNFSNSPTDRTQRLSTCDFLQPNEASFKFQQYSPSSFSSSLSSNFSPKKFKSNYGPMPSPSKTHEAVISPRNTSSVQPHLGKVCRCISEKSLIDTQVSSCHSPTVKAHPSRLKDSENVFQEQAELKKSFGHLAASYFNIPGQFGSAHSLAYKDTYLRTKQNLEGHSMTETELSDTQRLKSTQKSYIQNNEPDVFVFPDCGVKVSAASQQDQRRKDKRESDKTFPDCKIDESFGLQQDQRRKDKRETDKTFPDCKIDESFGSQQDSSRNSKGATDEPDGLDSPMETDDYSFHQNCRKLTPKHSMLSKSRPNDSLNSNYPWHMNNHTALQSSISENSSLNYDKNDAYSMTFTRDTHLMRVHDIHSEHHIMRNDKATAPLNRTSSEQHLSSFSDHRTHEHRVFKREASARNSHSSAAEIVDISESDDISQYLEDHESMLNEWTGKAQSFIRKSDSSNNRAPMSSLDRKEIVYPEDDYPVKTTADTNVCYISLNDFNSSFSSDDMEYDYENEDTTAYSDHMSQFYDFGDEPDGKNKKLVWKQKTDKLSVDQRGKSAVVSNAGPRKLANNCMKASDYHQSRNYHPEQHQSSVGLPGKPQLVLITKEPICHEKLSFVAEDTYRTAIRTSGHMSHSSSNSDGCIQNSHSTQDNQQIYHYHHSSRNKNMKPFFHELSKQEVASSDMVKRKHVLSVARKSPQKLHHHAQNNISSEQFADEVDGLGDKNKNQEHIKKTNPKTANPREETETKVVHCFDRNNPGSATHTATQSTAINVAKVRGDTNTSPNLPSTRSTLQTRHQANQVVEAVTFTTQQTVDNPMKTPESCSSLIALNTETHAQKIQPFQGFNQLQDMHRGMSENVSCKKHSDTNKEHTIVCQSPDAWLRRRKSDTYVADATESCLSRSQSSPSKLGLTDDAPSDRKPVSFHRPWLDKHIHKQEALIPAVTPGPLSSSCLCPAITSGPHVSSAFLRRLTFPANTPEYTHASLKQPVSSDNSNDEITGNKGNQYSVRSLGNTRKREDDLLIPSRDLPSAASAGPSKSLQQHHKRVTEGRPKRKLEFSTQDSRNEQPPVQRKAREKLTCSSIKNPQEPENDDNKHLSQEHEAKSDQVKEKSPNWQEEVNPSTSYSRPQGEESRSSPRNDDEVDIRVQIIDVFQESTRLLQRLEGIYQADDRSCACSRIEQNILKTALDMFRALGNEASSREFWMDQLQQTNHIIKNTLDLAENFRRLCRHGRQVTDVFPGSIVIRIKCRTVLSLVDLCELHAAGDLHVILYNILSQSVVFDKPGLTLSVTLDTNNVVTCQRYLLARMDTRLKTRSGTRKKTQTKMASMRGVRSAENLLYSPCEPSSPCSNAVTELCRSPLTGFSAHAPSCVFGSQRERKFSFGEVNRTAFQELNISDVTSPTSPSFGRLLRDDTCQILGKPDLILASSGRLNSPSPNLLSSPKLLPSPGSSPLTSPRKLSVRDIISEQENIDHNND